MRHAQPGVFEEQTMSELSFQTFCIEFYSRHIQRPGPEVYELFRKSGLLDMLKTDYQIYLTGKETPRVKDLWNEPDGVVKGVSHKDEESLSDHIKSYLNLVLQKVVANREVQLNRGDGKGKGAKTDLWLTAISKRDETQLQLCIEVKGSWNRTCQTAFKDQLCQKYMGAGGANVGIFLVGWFWSGQGCHHKNQWNNDRSEAERFLAAQEAELRNQGYNVRHLIIDCSYCR